MQCGQQKPNQRHKKKAFSGFEGLLEIVGLDVTMESVRTGACSESWTEYVMDFRGSNKLNYSC